MAKFLGIILFWFTLLSGRGQGFFGRPAKFIEPLNGGAVRNSELFAQFRKRLAFSVPVNPMIVAAISVLNFLSCPAAVLRIVSFRIVAAIQGMIRRGLQTKIGDEAFNSRLAILTKSPAITDRNSSASIIDEGFLMGIITALKHGAVCDVLCRNAASARHAVSGLGGSHLFFSQASAALGATVHKAASDNRFNCAAVATYLD